MASAYLLNIEVCTSLHRPTSGGAILSLVLDLQDVYPTSGGDSRQDGRRLRCGVEHLGSRGNHFGVSDGKETYVNGIVVAPSGSPTPLPGRSAHCSQEPVSYRWSLVASVEVIASTRPAANDGAESGRPRENSDPGGEEPSGPRFRCCLPKLSLGGCVTGRDRWPSYRSRSADPRWARRCVGSPRHEASVRTQHLHEDRKIEASVVLGCCLKQLGSVETLRRPRRPSCLMPCFPGRRVGPST